MAENFQLDGPEQDELHKTMVYKEYEELGYIQVVNCIPDARSAI